VAAVDFYFDLLCPWAYQTSKWIREARIERDISVSWRFFSLEEVKWKAGEKHPWERRWSYGWSVLRLAARLRRGPGGNDAVDRFYEVAGRMLHEEGVKVHTPEGVETVLLELGEDPQLLAEALGDDSTSNEVRSDHEMGVDRGVFGVPTLVIDGGDVIYGPVITPAPTGAAAGRLWDAVSAWTEFPHLYEMQRPRLEADWEHIGREFEAYGIARGWSTSKRGETAETSGTAR
jgi:2-hydroxychromene-2-carboxylate isomerase